MSSSDEAADVDKQVLDRLLFVQLLSDNPVVVEKSKTPNTVAAKKTAWDRIAEDYSMATGKTATPKSLAKMLNNMKTKIKIKTDKRANGNKKVLFKDWEKDFLKLISQEESLVFKQIPVKAFEGLFNENQLNENHNMNVFQPTTSQNTATPISKKGAYSVMLYETEETKDMTTPELQRAVLLQQMELQRIQIEKEKLLFENLKNLVMANHLT